MAVQEVRPFPRMAVAIQNQIDAVFFQNRYYVSADIDQLTFAVPIEREEIFGLSRSRR